MLRSVRYIQRRSYSLTRGSWPPLDFEIKISIGVFNFQLAPSQKKKNLGHRWSLFAYYQLTSGILDPNKFMVGHFVNHYTCCSSSLFKTEEEKKMKDLSLTEIIKRHNERKEGENNVKNMI